LNHHLNGEKNMTRLLLCTATTLALTASAHAQRESGNYMGGFGGTNIIGSIPKRSVCAWSISPGEKAWCQQPAQVQRNNIKKKGQ
jgi:hypothetical protein